MRQHNSYQHWQRRLLLLMGCLLLTGCWDRHEVNDLAIVMATGIDYAQEKVELTAQIFIPRKAGGGEGVGGTGGSPSGVTMIRTAEGATVAEALNRLQRKVSRDMFWGHCEVIVISEQAGKQGLREYIDFFLRYPQIREHAYVFSSEKEAKGMLALLDPLERSSAESLREMANLGLGARVTLLELAQSIEGPSQSAILTRLLVTPANPGQEKLVTTPFVRGLSLYKKDKYVRTVTEPLSVGVLLLVNELNNIIMPVEIHSYKGSMSIRLIDAKAKIRPQIIHGEWSVGIDIEARGEVVLNTTDAELSNPAVMVEVQEAWQNRLKSLTERAVALSQNELKTDLFRFATAFRQRYPRQWREQQTQWPTIFHELKVDIRSKALITRTGKSTEPQGRADQSRK